ncbi:MAG: hypothetical protein LBM93_04985 [Oscillospiraceae bacterium]|nr:hypothetical protein [Oscillospiraceae bacterium]
MKNFLTSVNFRGIIFSSARKSKLRELALLWDKLGLACVLIYIFKKVTISGNFSIWKLSPNDTIGMSIVTILFTYFALTTDFIYGIIKYNVE